MKKPIHYIMRHARRARIVISNRAARWTLTGSALALAMIGFGVMAQAVPGLRKPSDRGAERLLVEMGQDQSDPRQNLPEVREEPLPAAPREETPSVIEEKQPRQNRQEPRSRNSNREVKRQPPARTQPPRETRPQRPQPAVRAAEPVRLDSQGPGLTGFPTSLDPTPLMEFKYEAPEFYRGIYITNEVIRIPSMYEPLLKQSKEAGMNTLVVDVQLVHKDHRTVERMPPEAFMTAARSYGFYLVARVVVHQGGFNSYPPPLAKLASVLDTAENAARMGFMEIQLDYIRFADNYGLGVKLDQRYRMVSGVLKMATDRLRPYGVRIGADVFGRIVFNNDDIIGQKVEVFSNHMDTLYPMLYPSHFYGELDRRKNPYKTIYDGVKASRARSGRTRVIAYIQGFPMRVHESGLTLQDYIKAQIKASEDSGGDGFIVWHAANQYGAFFAAYSSHKNDRARAARSQKRPVADDLGRKKG
jgi:hypothetical protein